MKIGIDAYSITDHRGGIANVAYNLIINLAKIDQTNEYFIFIRPQYRYLFDLPDNFHIKLVKHPHIIVWDQFFLPIAALRYKLDILHVPGFAAPFFSNTNVILTLHDVTFKLFANTMPPKARYFWNFVVVFSARRANLVLTDSKNSRNDIINLLKIPPEKVVTVYCGIDSRFKLIKERAVLERVRYKYKLPDHFILSVGVLEPRKNIDLLVQSYLKAARMCHQKIYLVVVGEIRWKSYQIAKLIVQGRIPGIIYLGHVPDEDLPAIYNLADVFVYTSKYEGFGLPLLEAMACGTPVISVNNSSLPEVVGNGGILVSEDSDRIAGKIAYVIANPEAQTKLRLKGLTQASRFSWKKYAQQVLDIYSRLVSMKKVLSL